MNSSRTARTTSSFFSKTSWICNSCAKSRQARVPWTAGKRALSSSARNKQNLAPTHDQLRAKYTQRNTTALYYGISIILGTVTVAYGSVPFYKMICQTTGWGGQPIKSTTHSGSSSSLTPLTDHPRIRITFASTVSDTLPWTFIPSQREVRVVPGETALAFYTATNRSADDIIGIATYSVTPAQVAPYFSKIQCFCFEEQRLRAGENVDMPVFFYIDPEIVKDLNCKGVRTVTLNYTFFKAKYDREGHL
ncbi:hypothetical protein K402DRAFT_307350, partial [Aulographum hederae CBS 113979]